MGVGFERYLQATMGRGGPPVSPEASHCPSPTLLTHWLHALVSLLGHSPLCTAMTGRWCCVKLLRRGEESWGDGLLKGDLSISVFFTVGEMPEAKRGAVSEPGTQLDPGMRGSLRTGSARVHMCVHMSEGVHGCGQLYRPTTGVHINTCSMCRHVLMHGRLCTSMPVCTRVFACAGAYPGGKIRGSHGCPSGLLGLGFRQCRKLGQSGRGQ